LQHDVSERWPNPFDRTMLSPPFKGYRQSSQG